MRIESGARRLRNLDVRTFLALACMWAGAGTPAVAAPGLDAQQDPPVASLTPAIVTSEDGKSAPVTFIASEITVDGSLSEEAWQNAPTIGDLTQREPDTGEKPSEPTKVTLLHDANYLYIGVMAYDSEPDRIIGAQLTRDASLGSDDRIEI